MSKRIKVLTEDDRLDEPDGSITVRVVDDSGQYKYVPGWSRSATSVVRDNDEPVSVSIGWVRNAFVGDVLEGLFTLFVLSRTSDSGEMTVHGRVTQVGEFLDTSRGDGLEYPEDGRFQDDIFAGTIDAGHTCIHPGEHHLGGGRLDNPRIGGRRGVSGGHG